MSNEIKYEIVEHICVLAEKGNGWNREINIVAWNGGRPKFDIRDWDENHERMTKGITLTEDEAKALTMALHNRFTGKE